MFRVMMFVCGVLLPFLGMGQSTTIALQTDVQLTLSLEQEVEEAISRGQRWLTAHRATTPDDVRRLLEELAHSNERILFYPRSMVHAFNQHVEAFHLLTQARYDEITQALNQGTLDAFDCKPFELFVYVHYSLLPRSVHATLPKPAPSQWRTQIALKLVNAQRVDAKGGFWDEKSETETLWAVLLLRSLIYRLPALCPFDIPDGVVLPAGHEQPLKPFRQE